MSRTKNLVTPPFPIPLRTNLPKLSLTPILRDPNIRVGVDASITPTHGISRNGHFVAATVKGNTHGGVSAGHVDVFAAEGVDGVDDAPVLFHARVFHYGVVPFGVGVGGGGEEEGAEGEEEEGEAGDDAGHCCGSWLVLFVCFESGGSVVLQTTEEK
jgi:hypothetical protein